MSNVQLKFSTCVQISYIHTVLVFILLRCIIQQAPSLSLFFFFFCPFGNMIDTSVTCKQYIILECLIGISTQVIYFTLLYHLLFHLASNFFLVLIHPPGCFFFIPCHLVSTMFLSCCFFMSCHVMSTFTQLSASFCLFQCDL